MKKLIPPFLRKADRHLRENYPWIWSVQTHHQLWLFLIFTVVSALIGLLAPISHDDLPSVEITFTLLLIPTFFWAAYLIYRMLRFNPRRYFGKQKRGIHLVEMLLIIFNFSLCLTLPYTAAWIQTERISALCSLEELETDYMVDAKLEAFYNSRELSYWYDNDEYLAHFDFLENAAIERARLLQEESDEWLAKNGNLYGFNYELDYETERRLELSYFIDSLSALRGFSYRNMVDSILYHEGVFGEGKKTKLYIDIDAGTPHRLTLQEGYASERRDSFAAEVSAFYHDLNLERYSRDDLQPFVQQLEKTFDKYGVYNTFTSAHVDSFLAYNYMFIDPIDEYGYYEYEYQDSYYGYSSNLPELEQRLNYIGRARIKDFDMFEKEAGVALLYAIFGLSLLVRLFRQVHWKAFILSGFTISLIPIILGIVLGSFARHFGEELFTHSILFIYLFCVIIAFTIKKQDPEYSIWKNQALIIAYVFAPFFFIYIHEVMMIRLYDFYESSIFDGYINPCENGYSGWLEYDDLTYAGNICYDRSYYAMIATTRTIVQWGSILFHLLLGSFWFHRKFSLQWAKPRKS